MVHFSFSPKSSCEQLNVSFVNNDQNRHLSQPGRFFFHSFIHFFFLKFQTHVWNLIQYFVCRVSPLGDPLVKWEWCDPSSSQWSGGHCGKPQARGRLCHCPYWFGVDLNSFVLYIFTSVKLRDGKLLNFSMFQYLHL